MNFQEFNVNWRNLRTTDPEYIREGQSLMNYLGDVWLEEYKRISSQNYYDKTDIDCFYQNKLVPNTLKHLEKVWVNYPK